MGLYFIAIILPENLKEEIKELKLEVAEKFSAKHALKLPAHITLQPPFKINEEQEVQLKKFLENFVQQQNKFLVELDGFGNFAPRVIFVNIKNKQPLLQLYDDLEKNLDNFKEIKEKRESPFHPHITIATRDLERKLFQKAWADFKERIFHGIFEAQKVSLLKHNGRSWEINSEYYFKIE